MAGRTLDPERAPVLPALTATEPPAAAALRPRAQPPLSAVIQRARLDPRALTRADVAQLQRSIGNAAVGRLLAGAPAPNRTGLPDGLKANVEAKSGLSMDDVRVHYNSPKPAAVQAHAYAQGTEIHIAPGQERHLPHEAWHVVQQKQGRVQHTFRSGGTSINDSIELENEAEYFAYYGKIPFHSPIKSNETAGKGFMAGPIQRIKIIIDSDVIETDDFHVIELEKKEKYFREVDDGEKWEDQENLTKEINRRKRFKQFDPINKKISANLNQSEPSSQIDSNSPGSGFSYSEADPSHVASSNNHASASANPSDSASPDNLQTLTQAIESYPQNALKKVTKKEKSDYGGPTIGTEQEITGYKIICAEENRGPFAHVEFQGKHLAYLTSDMGSFGEYTIEIVTTPYVRNDVSEINRRLRASSMIIDAIKLAGEENRPVVDKTEDEYKLIVNSKIHRIKIEDGIIAYGNQVTLGFQVEDFKHIDNKNHELRKNLPWILDRAEVLNNKDGSTGSADVSNTLSSDILVMLYSVISKLGDIISNNCPKSDNQPIEMPNITHRKIKNEWGTLPRTPPLKWLKALDAKERSKVLTKLSNMIKSDFEKKAFDYILSGQSLGGHVIPSFTIEKKPTAAFEIRYPGGSFDGYFFK